MNLYFVSNPDSAYYDSEMFGKCIAYAMANLRRCELGEVKGKRRLLIHQVPTVEEGVNVLKDIAQQRQNS